MTLVLFSSASKYDVSRQDPSTTGPLIPTTGPSPGQ
jgi:hypothetical protein